MDTLAKGMDPKLFRDSAEKKEIEIDGEKYILNY